MHYKNTNAGRNTLAWTITALCASLITPTLSFGANNEEALEEIQVTGSRIRVTDGMATPTPVTALTPDELSSFEPGATITTQLEELPQFFGSLTAQNGGLALSGTAGASFLNMRNIGTNRTLVLLDGMRMAPADKRGPVNADTLPTALVRSIDVVTGGASAAYGADALGGVTNFILDRNFRGLKVSAGSGISEFGDGFRWNTSIAGGKQFFDDRLSIIGSFESRFIEQYERNPEDLSPDWYQRWNYVTNPAWLAAGCTVNVYCDAGPQRLLMPNVAPTNQFIYGMIMNTGTILDRMVFNRAGTEVQPISNLYGDYSSDPTITPRGNLNSTSGGRLFEIYNQSTGTPISGAEVVGRSSFTSAKWQFTDDFSAYVQLVHGVSESNDVPTRADTSGINLSSTCAPLIAIDNVYVPEFVRQTLQAAGRTEFRMERNGAFLGVPDIGINQKDRNIFTSNTYSVGFEWNLPRDWRMTGSYSTGKTERKSMVYNMTRVDRMFLAMDAVRDPQSGNIVCRVNLPQYRPTVEQLAAAGLASGLLDSPSSAHPNPGPLKSPVGLDNTIRDCVPFNVMGFGNISQEAIDYIGTDKMSIGIVEQDFAEAVLTGNIHDGWGYGPIGAAFGLTWRDSSFVDEAFPTEVDELGPPRNAPNLGIRGIPAGYTDGAPNLHQFSTVPYVLGEYNVWEWFTELQVPFWEAANGIQRLGGNFAFRRSSYNISGSSDSWKVGLEATIIEGLRLRGTKSHDVREASFAERFDEQGGGGNVRDPLFGDTNVAISIVARGNPNLAPEAANTNVLGLVWQPTWAWADGLSISADWYEINIDGEIQQISAQDVMDRCFAGEQAQCANIIRDEFNIVGTVIRQYFNMTHSITSGVDFETSYRFDPDFFANHDENFNLRLIGGYTLERADTATNGTVTDFTGIASPPDLTFSVNLNYGFDAWSVGLQGRFNGSGKRNRTWINGIQANDNIQSSYTFWNGSLNYGGELDSGATWRAGLSVQNLFDRKPLINPGNGLGGSDGDGRRYNLSFNMNF
ncbi:MAG: TonB-dependent receptor [Pseudomonadales bacterium]|jgi:outer membrane receptor protein involved in Fe transport|nr:TonB-dependent receptor [Pseudomonadales bacterium]